MTLSSSQYLDENEALEMAYDLFLEHAIDNLDPADVLLFNLQFEENGGAEIVPLTDNWQQLNQEIDPQKFIEVVIGMAPSEEDDIDDIYARVLLNRDKLAPQFYFLWRK